MKRQPMTDHRPAPGPDYWAWRCLICDQPVSEHPGLLRRLWSRLTNRASLPDG